MEKNENRGTNRNGRRFDEEFKRDAVAVLKSGEHSAQQLSQDLGVSVWSLKRWSKEFSIGGQTGPGALTLSEPASALEIARLRRELEFVTRQRDILKKSLEHLGSGSVELFEMIATMKNDQDARYSVVELCLALGVSRSGFYDHEQKPDCERRREDGVLAQKISLLFLEGRRTYGSRRIQKGLLREGIQLMRDQELEVIQKHAFRPKTTQSCHTINRLLQIA